MLMENVNYDPPSADESKRFASGFCFLVHELQVAAAHEILGRDVGPLLMACTCFTPPTILNHGCWQPVSQDFTDVCPFYFSRWTAPQMSQDRLL